MGRPAESPKKRHGGPRRPLGTPTLRKRQEALNIFWTLPGPRGDPQGARRGRIGLEPRRGHDFRENGVGGKRPENTPREGKD